MPEFRMNFRASAALLLTVLSALWLSSCSSPPKIKGIPSKLPTIAVNGIVRTPPHSMPTYAYPFDSSGRYVSEWAAEGEKRSGRSAVATNADQEKWTGSHEGNATGRQIVLKTTPPSKPKSGSTTKSKPVVKVATKSGSSTSKPKPTATSKAGADKKKEVASSSSKPKPKSTSGSSGGGGSYSVQKGDTLSSIARRNNTSVAKLKAANGMSSDFLSIGKSLKIPK